MSSVNRRNDRKKQTKNNSYFNSIFVFNCLSSVVILTDTQLEKKNKYGTDYIAA